MKVAFFSNFLNHHQLTFCLEMIKLIGVNNFTFVATRPISKQRLRMGYADMNSEYSFVLRAYESETTLNKAKELAEENDIVILGSAPNEFLNIRMKKNLLTFRAAERFFKKGIYRRFNPINRIKVFKGYIKYRKNNFYVLTSSAYTSYDLTLCGFPAEKCIKWGYFPETKKQDLNTLIDKKNTGITKILWAGRFIEWKKTQDAIEVVRRLKDDGYVFLFNIIGCGKNENKLKNLVRKYNLSAQVSFLGAMSPEKVRSYMESANIYLLTSNFEEGWGAVLNEAMNSGCAIVSSHAAGAVPYLLENGKNGLIYEYGNFNDFYNKVKYLIDNPGKQQEYGNAAYSTVFDIWSASIAANRFLRVSKNILIKRKLMLYNSGPCSRAEIIKNDWFKEKYE